MFTPDDFLNVHRDMVDPIARDFVRYAIMAVDAEQPQNTDARAAADSLRRWDFTQNTSWSVYRMTSIVSTVIKRTLRGTPMESRYLGSDAGLIQLFRDMEEYEKNQGGLIPDADIRAWLIAQLGEVYRRSGIADAGARPLVVRHSMPWQNNLEGIGTLNPSYDQVSPPLTCGVVATIWSQLGNSYSHIVDLSLVDSSLSILPPGNSEIPSSRHFSDMIPLWVDGGMHPAPLSWAAIQPHEESRTEWRFIPQSAEDENVSPSAFRITDIWPNPGSGPFALRCEGVTSGDVSMTVRDILGREMAIVTASPSSGSAVLRWMPPASLSAGMYLLTLRSGTAATSSKIMLQR